METEKHKADAMVPCVNDLSSPWRALVGGSYSHCWLQASLCPEGAIRPWERVNLLV